MTALGQKQTSRHLQPMSALPPIADVRQRSDFISFQIPSFPVSWSRQRLWSHALDLLPAPRVDDDSTESNLHLAAV
jgi:hypothetical protein